MKDMEKTDFHCRECAFTGSENLFGLNVKCPECGSHAVVLAAVWERYNSNQSVSAEVNNSRRTEMS